MRGELDDTLARMARREELQRRRMSDSVISGKSPVDEVTEAVQRVVGQHPSLAVTMWVADGPVISALHVAWSEGAVTVRPAAEPAMPTAGQQPRSWPVAVKTAPTRATPATEPPASPPAQ